MGEETIDLTKWRLISIQTALDVKMRNMNTYSATLLLLSEAKRVRPITIEFAQELRGTIEWIESMS